MSPLQKLGSSYSDRLIESSLDASSADPEEDKEDQRDGHSGRVLLVDASTITRERLVHMMRSRAADLEVTSVPDCHTHTANVPNLILINIHDAMIDDPEVQGEIAELRWTYGASRPTAVIADRNEWKLAIISIRDHALRGYIPTSLNPGIFIAAVRLILAGGTFAPMPTENHEPLL